MLEVLSDLLTIFWFSFVTGIGLYRLIVPRFLRTPYLSYLLPAGIGLFQLAIVDGYVIYNSGDIHQSARIDLFAGLAALAASIVVDYRLLPAREQQGFPALFRRQLAVASAAASRFRALVNWKAAVAALVLCAVAAPLFRAGFPTTPYRIGIDQVGYAEAAQCLVERCTLDNVRSRLLAELQTKNVRKAYAQNLKAIPFETYVDSEFLLKAFRWGFPGVLATFTLLTGSDHVYRIEFSLLLISYGLMMALFYLVLRAMLRLSELVSMIAVVALALNCNLLNIYYEGQLAQTYTTPCIMMLLMVYLSARSRPYINVSVDGLRELFLFGFCVATLFCAYNEALVLVFGLAYLTWLLDLVFQRKTNRRGMALVCLGAIVGAAVAYPVSVRWLLYSVANIAGLSHAGFWQPHWASLAEMLGFLDMYTGPGYELLARSAANEVLAFGVSVAAVYFLARAFLSKHIDRAFWAAPLLIILAAYLKMKFFDQILNYPYMKIYTILLPFVVAIFVVALFDAVPQIRRARVVRYAALVIICLTGLVYIGRYVTQSGYVTRDMFALYADAGRRKFQGVVIETPRYQPEIKDFMLVSLMTMNWLNEDNGEKYVRPYLKRRVAVWIGRGDVFCFTCMKHKYRRRILFQNDSFALLDAGVRVRNVCVKEAAQYVIGSLGYDSQEKEWPGLPSPQCDYRFGLRVREEINA